MPVPGIGWLCYAKDPDGNIFGMLQPDHSALDPAGANRTRDRSEGEQRVPSQRERSRLAR